MEYSDEENPVTTADIMEMLEKNDIFAERKSVYSDIELLSDMGLDIIKVKKPKAGYYVGARDFELVEIQILTDAVQSANFITPGKSKNLVKKIGTLCSEAQMKKISTRVYIDNRVKCENEQIYYFIDVIGRGIDEGKQIRCLYEKSRAMKNFPALSQIEKEMVLNPYALIWSSDHYYLVANNPKYDNLMHLRIDRIRKAEVIETSTVRPFSEVSEYKTHFDVADYARKRFNMFSGEAESIKLLCNISVMEQIIDRFGTMVTVRKNYDDEGTFYVNANAAVNEGLIGWIMQFSDKITVIEPESLKDGIRERAQAIYKLYG